MPTLRLKVNAGAPVEAKPGPNVAPGDALQLVLSSTTGVDKVRWRIVSFPDGFDPSGSWLLVGSAWECYGIDGSSQISLPGSGFDTYLFEAILNDGLTNGVADPSLTLRGGAVVRSASGLRQLAYLETDHIDIDREWVSAIRELIAAADSGPTQGRQSHADAVLWYPLSADSGTFTNSGTAGAADLPIYGTALGQIPGPLGKAAYLYADAGFYGAASKTLGSGACTIWAWIVPDKGGLVWGRYKTTDGSKILTLEIAAGKLLVSATGDGGTATATSDRPVITGVPNLLACVYDPSDSVTIAAFVNGVRSGENASVGAIRWSTETPGQCLWGGGLSAHTDECPGIYCELGGAARAYSGAEIAEMYRRGMGWR